MSEVKRIYGEDTGSLTKEALENCPIEYADYEIKGTSVSIKLYMINGDTYIFEKIVREMFEDALMNNNVQIGKEYVFTNGTKTHIDFDILNSEDGLENGEIIKIISSNTEELTEGNSDDIFLITDYNVQREDGEIVTIGQKAGRT